MIFRHKRLFWQIFTANVLIILGSIIAVGWYSSRSVDSFYVEESATDLSNRANLVRSTVAGLLAEGDAEKLKKFAIDSGRASGTRITIIDQSGKVLADSNEDPARMDNHRSRPEIDTAFGGAPGSSMRFSNTLGERMLYSAIPLTKENGSVTTVLRLSLPVTGIDRALRELSMKITVGTVVALLVAFFITMLVTRNMSKPLEEMTRSAANYSKGDFSQRMMMNKATASREITALAAAMDEMAVQLDEKINTIINQRNQLETVFSSMVEAVIAVDRGEKIISINEAAASMFKVDRRESSGALVQGVIRNVAIHQKIKHVLETEESLEDEITLMDGTREIFLQTNVVSLYNGLGESIGVLVVLNDVTRLRRLENVRSDFVANVSHELRTPITSIRGYVETLLDGAIDDHDDAVKFLDIVLRQSEQLSEIIDDLLALSRIEQHAQEEAMDFESQELLPLLEDAVQTCSYRAEQREVRLSIDCSADIKLKMNRTLLEQAIINLLINGITYSEKGGTVTIKVSRLEGEDAGKLQIRVIDNGIGIAKEHLPRLFERFYRSDKARSRKAGGTGLGLAIVKHIVQAHNGRVDVRSKLGEGSEFIITLTAV